MAIFKPFKCLESQLSSLPVVDGQVIFTTDTKRIYTDIDTNRVLYSSDDDKANISDIVKTFDIEQMYEDNQVYSASAINEAISELQNSTTILQWDGNTEEEGIALWQKVFDLSQTQQVAVIAMDYSESKPALFVVRPGDLSANASIASITSFVTSLGNSYTADQGYQLQVAGPAIHLELNNGVITKVLTISYSSATSTARYLPTDKTTITSYEPTYDYHPATKKYVDDTVANIDTTALETSITELETKVDSIAIPEYTMVEVTTTSGYAKTYSLTKDGTEVGVKINIPKDLVISSGTVAEVTTVDTPYTGAAVGDKYLDLVLNDSAEDHIYIPVKDLVDVYTGVDGSKLTVTINSDNSIEATIKSGTIEKTDLTSSLQTEIDSKSTASNLVNGEATGSLRAVGTPAESDTYKLGVNATTIGAYTWAEGAYAFAEGYEAHAEGNSSHAEGQTTYATGSASHAEGYMTKATANWSHSEGGNTEANGRASHAEGWYAHADGQFSHAEGSNTVAAGANSHAEGSGSDANGTASHAEGLNTIASGNYQHTAGKNNVEDTENKYAYIIGNGESSDARSNAHTVDWSGNGWFQGDIKVGGTGQDDTSAKTLATTEYVDSNKGTVIVLNRWEADA